MNDEQLQPLIESLSDTQCRELDKLLGVRLKQIDLVNCREIHRLTVDALLAQLALSAIVPPGILQAALRFLNENELQSIPKPGSRVDELRGKVPFPVKAPALKIG